MLFQYIVYYPISILHTRVHPTYDEAIEKIFENPIKLDVLAGSDWEEATNKWNIFGYEVSSRLELFVQARDLIDKEINIVSGDFFVFGADVFEIIGTSVPEFIYGQPEYEKAVLVVGKLARAGQLDIETYKKFLIDSEQFAESQVQKDFLQQRGLAETEEGATADTRQIRDRLGDDMAEIALGEGPRKVSQDRKDKNRAEPTETSVFQKDKGDLGPYNRIPGSGIFFFPVPVNDPIAEPWGPGGSRNSLVAAQYLFDFAKNQGLDRIIVGRKFFDNSPDGEDYIANMNAMVELAHKNGLTQEVTVSSTAYIEELSRINFDAIHLDFESFAGGGIEPSEPEDFDLYRDSAAIARSYGRKVYASIGWHWDEPSDNPPYNAYQEILNTVDGLDIQVQWGRSVVKNGHVIIANRTRDIIEYANQISKPAWITVTTKRKYPEDYATEALYQAALRTTFWDEGEEEMKNVEDATNVILLSDVAGPIRSAGFMHVHWLNSYGSGWDQWPVRP